MVCRGDKVGVCSICDTYVCPCVLTQLLHIMVTRPGGSRCSFGEALPTQVGDGNRMEDVSVCRTQVCRCANAGGLSY
jgi:hypothetical protein